MTTVVHEPAAFRAALDEARRRSAPIVGTRHLTLVDEARRRTGAGGVVAVTIFVNPLQFGPKEDFARYPRTLETDLGLCRARGVDLVFAPERTAMYPEGFASTVRVAGVTEHLEGAHRPG